jgi:hypothetical protein
MQNVNLQVRCYVGDNEERWFLWYSGRGKEDHSLDAVSPAAGSIGAWPIRTCILQNCLSLLLVFFPSLPFPRLPLYIGCISVWLLYFADMIGLMPKFLTSIWIKGLGFRVSYHILWDAL